MHYQIFDDETIEGLVKQVQAAIEEGFTPQGGVAVASYEVDIERKGYAESRQVFVQAMTKDD